MSNKTYSLIVALSISYDYAERRGEDAAVFFFQPAKQLLCRSCCALLLKVDFHLPSQLRLSITHRPPDDKRQMSCTSLYRCLIFKYLWLTLCIFSLPHPMVNTFSLLQNLFPHFGTICCVPLHNSCGPQMGPAPQFRNHCSRRKQVFMYCLPQLL